MTAPEIGSLASALKNVDCCCLPKSAVLTTWLAAHPHVDASEAAFVCMVVGRVPFPSVDGNPPVYRDRPYFDSRGRQANGRPH
jgi:hypothetical protein